jgi:uncharacterized membrane protein YkvA (DUF1232 family)
LESRWQARLKAWHASARQLKAEVLALYYSLRDPRTPWYARIVGALVVAYAFSPLDLIPDFVPVLGYLDDLLLLPIGVWLTLRMIPPPVMAENRIRAQAALDEKRPVSWAAAVAVVLVWIAAIAVTALVAARLLAR